MAALHASSSTFEDTCLDLDPSSLDINSILIIAVDYPNDIAWGLNEIASNIKHINFVTKETMIEKELAYKWNIRFIKEELGTSLTLCSTQENFKSFESSEGFDIVVTYSRKVDAFRGLGHIFGAAMGVEPSGFLSEMLNVTEEAKFDTLGIMVDCSRNAVLKPESLEFLLRQCALMGINSMQLYTEDTFEVEGLPFFGYLRGSFKQQELSDLDTYAYNFGIEMFPCIQTLGHLGQVLQWPRFANLRDTCDVLLTNCEDTYHFLERVITAASAPFRSRKIHIGMDEAYGLGEGRYRQMFGYKDGTTLFMEHLQQVTKICKKFDLEPILWSDMLFCLANKDCSLQGYYDNNISPALPEVVSNMPKECGLVYWDYYHTDPECYKKKIKTHRELSSRNPWMATGLWTWNRFWTALPFTFESEKACMQAAKEKDTKLDHIMTTIWGDDGNEADIFSSLPGLLYYAQQGYTNDPEVDIPRMKRNFMGICGGDFDDWVYACRIDDIIPRNTRIDSNTYYPPNTSKWLLWQDPFYSFLSPQYQGYSLEQHYATLSSNLMKLSQKSHLPLNQRLKFPALIARVLSRKCHIREHLRNAYQQKDTLLLLELANTTLLPLCKDMDELWHFHREMWLKMNKPFGLEVLEIRYGGIRTRLQSMYDRVIAYCNRNEESRNSLDAHITEIPELEVDLQLAYPHLGMNLVMDYQRAATPMKSL